MSDSHNFTMLLDDNNFSSETVFMFNVRMNSLKAPLCLCCVCGHVTGTPFQFLVTDLSRATARGEGLSQVKCGQTATFFITAPSAQLKDICVTISGT